MSVSPEALEIILQLQGVPTYVSGMQAASGANDEFAASSRRVAAMSDEAAAAEERMAAATTLVGKSMKVMGFFVVAAMVDGVKESIKFQAELKRVHTQAGATAKEVGYFNKEVLALAKSGKVRQGPNELAEGLYHLVSVGLRGAKAMEALKIAAQGAAIGNAKVSETASALGAAWLVGNKGAGDLHNTMAILNATVGAGNLRMEDFIQSLKSGLLPVAKVAKLNLMDVGAAIATLGDSGYSAASGAAQLGTALHFLYDPSAKAKKALESIGLSQRQLFEDMKSGGGLRKALEDMKNALGAAGGEAEQSEKLGEILPGGRGKVLLTLMEELERYNTKHTQIVREHMNYDKLQQESTETSSFRIGAAWAMLRGDIIELGEEIEGPATKALVGVIAVLGGLLSVIKVVTLNGKLLIPIIGFLTVAWTVNKLAVLGSAYAMVTWKIVGIIATVIALIPEIGSLTDAWVLLSLAMDANPIGVVVAAFAAGALVVYHFRKQIKELAGELGHFFGKTGFSLGNLAMLPTPAAPLGLAKILGFHFAEGGTMPYAGYATINENGPGEQVWLPGGSTVTPNPANSLSAPRSHTPTPLSSELQPMFNIEAWFQLPAAAGGGLFKLVTKEAAVSKARK